MNRSRGASSTATIIAIALLVVAAGSAAYLGIAHQRVAAENRRLSEKNATLAHERDEQARSLDSLTAQRRADQEELAELRRHAEERAAAATRLHDQVAALETRAGTLQDEIARARTDGTLKEGRIAELTRQLETTQASADAAQHQLKVLGYNKDELNDQVAKLQTRLTGSRSQLEAALKLTREQQQAIQALNSQLTGAQSETASLRQAAAELKKELDLRPRPSVSLESDAYRPSRDRKNGRSAG